MRKQILIQNSEYTLTMFNTFNLSYKVYLMSTPGFFNLFLLPGASLIIIKGSMSAVKKKNTILIYCYNYFSTSHLYDKPILW